MSASVSFLSQAEMDGFGRYAQEPPDRETLKRFFFLDDADRELVAEHRRSHSRLGFGLQLVTVRQVGRFLPDPLEVPSVVVDYVAVQLEIDDSSCVKRYLERRNTRYEHQAEIVRVYGYRDFAVAEAQFLRWLDDQGQPGTGRRRYSPPLWRGCAGIWCCCPG